MSRRIRGWGGGQGLCVGVGVEYDCVKEVVAVHGRVQALRERHAARCVRCLVRAELGRSAGAAWEQGGGMRWRPGVGAAWAEMKTDRR